MKIYFQKQTLTKKKNIINLLQWFCTLFDRTNDKEIYGKQEFGKSIDKKLIEQLDQPEKFQFIVDLQKFNNICFEINSVLLKHNYFLKVFELKNKYRHLLMKEPKKQDIVRQLSSCYCKNIMVSK